jgi:hypothetical protein
MGTKMLNTTALNIVSTGTEHVHSTLGLLCEHTQISNEVT